MTSTSVFLLGIFFLELILIALNVAATIEHVFVHRLRRLKVHSATSAPEPSDSAKVSEESGFAAAYWTVIHKGIIHAPAPKVKARLPAGRGVKSRKV